MDDSFFQELDAHITNVGTEKCWKRKVGDLVVWISPIPFDGQLQANDALAKLSKLTEDSDEGSGIDAIQETKRITLSHAIVGLDNFDLRKFRFAGPCIPVIQVREGREMQVKVELHRYMHSKIAGWGSELVDSVFDVYADLMETHKRDLLKEVKFENLKDPKEELAELEMKAAQIRDQLELPPMVEADPLGNERPSVELEEDGPGPSEDELPSPPARRQADGFDPFKPVEPREAAPPAMDDPPPRPPTPVQTVPVPVPGDPDTVSPIQKELAARNQSRPVSAAVVSAETTAGTPDDPHYAIPSVPVDVLEQPAEKKVVQPPRIDSRPTAQSRNPRFAPPNRR